MRLQDSLDKRLVAAGFRTATSSEPYDLRAELAADYSPAVAFFQESPRSFLKVVFRRGSFEIELSSSYYGDCAEQWDCETADIVRQLARAPALSTFLYRREEIIAEDTRNIRARAEEDARRERESQALVAKQEKEEIDRKRAEEERAENARQEEAKRRQAVIDESCQIGPGALDTTTLPKFALSGIRLGMSRTDFDTIFTGGVDEACNDPFEKSECSVVLPSNWNRAPAVGRLVCDPDAIAEERQQDERNPRMARRVGYPIEVKFWQGKLFYASLLVPRTAATEQFGHDALQAMPKGARKLLYKESGYEGWASGASEFLFVAIASGALGKSFADIDAGTPGKSRAGYRITLEDTAISKIYDREYEKRAKAAPAAPSTSVRSPTFSSKPPESRLRDFTCRVKCTFGGVMVPSQVRITTASVKATSASDASGQIGLKMSQVCGSSPNGGALSVAFSGVQKCE
jgi:hypothetical protein